jgi:PadR family transcriptional regulator PadR
LKWIHASEADVQKRKDYREFISLPLYNRILLFSELIGDESLLFIYDKNTEKFRPFQSFVRIGLENNELCVHFHQNHSRDYTLGKFIEEYSIQQKYIRVALKQDEHETLNLPATSAEIDRMLKSVDKSKYTGARLLADYGELVKSAEIMEKTLAWEAKLRNKLASYGPLTVIGSYDADSLEADMVAKLTKNYKKVLVNAHNETTFYLPEFSTITKEAATVPALNLISKDVADEYVKASIETLLLSLLREKSLCGYDLLKEIYQKFGVLLSQGTIYPLLHHLEAKGLLKAEISPTTRGKIYSPTDTGKELIERRVSEFLRMQQYVAHFLNK